MIPPKRKREKNKKYRNDPSIHPLREGCIVVEVVDCDRKFRSAIGTRVFSFRRVDHPQHSLTIYRPLGQTFPISGNESRTHRGARRLLVNRAGRRVSCGGIAGNEGRRHFIASTSSFFLFFFSPSSLFFLFRLFRETTAAFLPTRVNNSSATLSKSPTFPTRPRSKSAAITSRGSPWWSKLRIWRLLNLQSLPPSIVARIDLID